MRLIHTTTLQPHDFFSSQAPPYAILSHRWEAEEITFQDLEHGKGPEKKGWPKVIGCCARAASDGWEYAWIDSCCIDKTSSAELSEAINSMFRWYRSASICYVYMSDVKLVEKDPAATQASFCQSLWFTRGWTLQELLAPSTLEFYDRDWEELGTKHSLMTSIAKATGISTDHLWDFQSASVAQKISWASKRVTTRIEDEAYCLLGLFDVNMPPLYGEGQKAFFRLQLEIMDGYDDESIFAWQDDERVYLTASPWSDGLLAGSPALFAKSGNVIRKTVLHRHEVPKPTNRGLLLKFVQAPTNESFQSGTYRHHEFIMPLNCARREPSSGKKRVVDTPIHLKVRRFLHDSYSRHGELFDFSLSPAQLKARAIVTAFFPQKWPQPINIGMTEQAAKILSIDFTILSDNGFKLDSITPRTFSRDGISRKYVISSPDGTTQTVDPHQADATKLFQEALLFEDHGPPCMGTLTFNKQGHPSCTLIYSVLWDRIVITDLAILHENETEDEFFECCKDRFKDMLYIKQPDRLSVKVAEKCYISAVLKVKRDATTGKPTNHLQLLLDDYERWPNDRMAWKQRDERRLRKQVERIGKALEGYLISADDQAS